MVTTLNRKGQTTIPKEIRDYLRLRAGDQVDFVIEDGQVVLRPAAVDVRELKGMLRREDGRVVSLEEMEKAIVEGALGKPE